MLVVFWTVGYIYYGATYSWGLPTSDTWTLFNAELDLVREQFSVAVAPVVDSGGWDVLAAIGLAIAVVLAGRVRVRCARPRRSTRAGRRVVRVHRRPRRRPTAGRTQRAARRRRCRRHGVAPRPSRARWHHRRDARRTAGADAGRRGRPRRRAHRGICGRAHPGRDVGTAARDPRRGRRRQLRPESARRHPLPAHQSAQRGDDRRHVERPSRTGDGPRWRTSTARSGGHPTDEIGAQDLGRGRRPTAGRRQSASWCASSASAGRRCRRLRIRSRRTRRLLLRRVVVDAVDRRRGVGEGRQLRGVLRTAALRSDGPGRGDLARAA